MWFSSFQLQAQVEDMLHNHKKLICAGIKEPGADAIWTQAFVALISQTYFLTWSVLR